MHWEVWRYRRFHVAFLLGWFALGILIGLHIGKSYAITTDAGLVMAALILFLGAVRSSRWWSVGVIIMAGLLLGTLRGSQVDAAYHVYEQYVGRTVTVEGRVATDAQQTKAGSQRFDLSHVLISGTKQVGEVFVTVYGNEEIKRGDRIMITGKLGEGFASYGAALSGATIEKITRPTDLIRDVRERFANAVRAVIVEPIASLGLGFVVGQRSTLPDALDEQLKVVGLTHIVVASGYNLTILVRFMMRSLSRHSRYLTLVGSLLVIILFVLFSGFSPSMNRAVIVTVLGLLAWYVGRRFHPLLLIGYVAAATAYINPMYTWSDLGWYLSFLAFAGILVVAPLAIALFYKKRTPSSAEQLVIETLSAEVMALPFIAFAFGAIPVVGLVANVLVAPLIPAAMALTALTGAISMVAGAVGAALALPTMVIIGYMLTIIEWLASLPFAQQEADIGLVWLIGWYGLVVGVGIYVRHRTGYNFYSRDRKLDI